MTQKLRILFAEDVATDFTLTNLILKKEGLDFDSVLIETEEDFVSQLSLFNPDIVISDYEMPTFNGMKALSHTIALNPALPFIILTGTSNELIAVECMRKGAWDYVIKENIKRLPFAIKECLKRAVEIKQKTEALDALAASEKRYKSLISQMTQGLAVHEIIEDENGNVVNYRFLEVNESFETLSGLSRDQVIGKTVLEVLPKTEPMIIEQYGQVAKTGESIIFQKYSAQLKKVFEILAYRIQPGQFVTVFSDVTERQNNLEALQESETRFRLLFENTPIGLMYFDVKGTLNLVNEFFVKAIGSSMDKLIGLDLINLPNKKMAEAIETTLLGKSASYEGFYDAITSGKKVEIIGKFAPVFAVDGSVLGGIGILDDVSDQKKAEKELNESEERFKKSFHSSPAAIEIIEFESNIVVEVNDAWCRLLGYSREMIVGKPADKVIAFDPDDLRKISQEISVKHAIQNTEICLFTRKKEQLTVLLSVEYYESGGVQYMISSMMDITDRKNAEEELIKLTRAVEQSPVSIVITDLNGTIDYINPKVSEVTGYSSSELLGKNPRLLSSGEHTSFDYQKMYKVIQAGGIWHGEFHNKTKQGDLIWESASISPVINDEGIMTHYIAVKEDITEWKRMQEVLKESENRYRDMFMNNPLPMYIFDLDSGIFQEGNAAMTKEYGYSSEEFANMKIGDIHEKGVDPEILPIYHSIDTDSKNLSQCKHFRKDGSYIIVEISSHAIAPINGRNLRLVIENNITDKLAADQALQHAKNLAEASDRLKTSFLNNISHEVRTPLNGIIGAVSLISDPDLTDVDLQELIGIITQSTDRLIQTITDFMDVSMLTSGNMEINKKEVHLSKLFEKLKQKFVPKATEKKLKFEVEIPDINEYHVFTSDEELIFKSMSQLIANSIKFTDKGKVVIGYRLKDENIELFVEDSGIGISKEAQSRIFDYFSQEDTSSVRRFEGSGLGLSIVNGLAALLGGSVSLESSKGLGSIFRFILPAGNISQIKVAVETPKVNIVKQPILLIAEDDESNFFVLEVVVKKSTGAKVIRATNGQEAVDFCRENPDITLILMDIKMPIMDGLEATKIIKTFRPELPVIAITAYAMSGDEQKALDAGCNDYLSKPVSMKTLVAKLEAFGITK